LATLVRAATGSVTRRLAARLTRSETLSLVSNSWPDTSTDCTRNSITSAATFFWKFQKAYAPGSSVRTSLPLTNTRPADSTGTVTATATLSSKPSWRRRLIAS